MLTSRPRTAASGTVSIHSTQSLHELLEDSCRAKSKNDVDRIKRKAQRSKSAGCISSHDFKQGRNLTNVSLVRDVGSWLSERTAKIIQEKTEFESSSVRNLYNSLLKNEIELNEEVTDYLSENSELHRRKQLLLMKAWTENVYDPLQTEISKEMNSENYKCFDRAKRDLYTQYLKYNNHKGNVFLDTISCDEYDPFLLTGHRPGPLKVSMKKLNDPLLHQISQKNNEDMTEIACETGLYLKDREIEGSRLPPLPLLPLGRHGTDCKAWSDMQLHDVHSVARQRSQKKILGIRSNTCMEFNSSWRQREWEPKITDDSLKFTKRKQFRDKHKSSILLA